MRTWRLPGGMVLALCFSLAPWHGLAAAQGTLGQMEVPAQHCANSAVFSADGQRILIAGDDSTLRVWSVSQGRELRRFVCPWTVARDAPTAISAVFSPGEKLVLTASKDRTARIWEVATGREVQRF